jgi:hypothetical protein
VDGAQHLQLLVADVDGVLGEQRHGRHVSGPDDVPLNNKVGTELSPVQWRPVRLRNRRSGFESR